MAASVAQTKLPKRQLENVSEDDQIMYKRSRDGLPSEFFTADDGDCDAVEDDLVLQVVKSLQEEINGTSDKVENSTLAGEVGERVVSLYDDLESATDDQLGISPSLTNSGEADDNELISNEFWSDLFENPSNSKGETEDVLHPFLSHCYSYNNRDYDVEYNTLLLSEDQQEWLQESFTGLASRGFPITLL